MRKFFTLKSTFKKTLLLIAGIVSILFINNNLAAQSLSNGGFEANTVFPGTGWTYTTIGVDVNGSIATTGSRTGTNNLSENFNNGGGFDSWIENTNPVAVSIGNYLHIIAWAKASSTDINNTNIWFGTNNTNLSPNRTLTTAYAQYSANFQNTGNAGTGLFDGSPYPEIGFNTDLSPNPIFNLDDVVAYSDANAASDLTAPGAASGFTTGTINASSISFTWTNGIDAGSPATGVQGVIILRTTNTAATAPLLNDQGIYSVAGSTSGPNMDKTGQWTIISMGAATDGSGGSYTDNTTSAGTTYKYAIINYDLAYNYSTALSSGILSTLSITSFSPTSGCANTTLVTITGTGFTGATAVTFGGTPAASFTPIDDVHFTATPAAGTTGAIAVTTPAGTATSGTNFTVNALPTANLSGSTTICNGSSATLSIAVTGSGTISGTLSDGTTTFAFSGTGPTITVNVSPTTTTTYTIATLVDANCTGTSLTGSATVTVTTLPVATFSYAATPYCSNAANPSPTFSGGGVAGTFTAAGGLSINAASGVVNLLASTPGTYTVTNTIAAAGGCGIVTATSPITITALPVATFSYAASQYCNNAANPSPTFSGGGVAGTFTAPGGLSINAASGVVNLLASTPGTYTVTNTIASANGCGVVTASSPITITALPVATFSYAASPYCSNAVNPSPTFSGGGAAGTFSSTAGLNFVSTSTGQINLATSTAGTYTVTNTIAAANGCGVVTSSSSITITKLPIATFSYTATPYCSNAANPSPTFSGGGVAGTFSSTAGLNFVSTSTGQINLATSTAGTYTVTNTIAAANGCGVVTATSNVTIKALPVATFSYTASPYCQNTPNPSPTFSGGGVAGIFSSSPGGLNFVSTSTGQINLATSAAGTYTVTNTIAAAGGCSVVTATNTVTVSPGTPTSPAANAGSGATCSQITANWNASVNATAYFLDVSTVPGFGSFVGTYNNLNVGNVTTLNITGLAAGTTYYYRVRANNTCGTSASSSVITYATLPATPAIPTATAGTGASCTGITANWNASANTTAYFLDVSIDPAFGSFVGIYNNLNVGNVLTLNVTGLTAGITYYYRVRASNTCGTSASSSVITYATLAGTPAIPGSITGPAAPCPSLAGNVYSITSVPNATTYTWTVPAGWTITGGAGTTSITVTAGSYGQNGNITVTAGNTCGTSSASNLAVTVSPGAPSAPGAITGSGTVCPNISLTYSITAVANATTYTWTVPTGWTITAGQGNTSLTVTTGAAGQNGNIAVTAGNSCGTSVAGGTQTINITPLIGANNTGYTTSTTKTDGNITVASASASPPVRLGYLKFPLTAIPAGATINSSTLNLTNNASGALSGVANNVTALGNNDPTTTPASTLYTAINAGTSYNGGTWNNAGTIPLVLNPTAISDIQSRISGYIAMGLVRGNGSSIYNFYGYNGGANAPVLTVNYTIPGGNLPVTVSPGIPATPGAITGNTTQCPSLAGQIYSITAVPNATSYTWTVPTGWTITANGTTNSITVTTGGAGQNGNITVAAVNTCGTSAANSLAVTVNPGTPATPTSIAGSGATCTGITANWNASVNATAYFLDVSTVNNFASFVAGYNNLNVGNVTTLNVTGLTAGTTYFYRVRANNSCGTSANSGTITYATLPATPATPGAITGTATQCPGLTGQFYSIATVASATTYTWAVPAGWLITAGAGTTSITVTTGAAGQNGNITVTAGNSCGTSVAKTLAVTVNPGTPATPGVISGNASQCAGLTGQTYSVTTVHNATTYTWTVPTGWTITAGAGTRTITVTAGSAGQNGNISVTAGNTCGTSAAGTPFAVIVNSNPTAGNITGSNTVCINSTITLTPNPTGNAPFTYTWSSSNIGVATVTTAGVANGIGTGTTNITYTVTDANGCTSATSANYRVTVTQPTANAITQATNINTICANGTVALTSNATGTPTLTYSWSSSNTGVATVDNTGLVTGVGAGTTNITYTVTDGNGCTSATSALYSLTVIAIPTGTFTATENSGIKANDNIICAGDNVTFAAPPGYGAYTFYVNGVQKLGPTTNNLFNTTTLNSGDKVTVNVANASNCGATFGPITITVNQPPTPTLSADTTTICQGDMVTFTAGGGGASSVYTFELNGNPVQSGASNIYTNSSLNNNDKVTVILTDANKCSATYATPIIITVNGLPSGTLTSNPSPATVCAGSNVTFTATSGFTSYEFFVSGISQGVSGSNIFSSTTLANGSVVTVKATNSSTTCSNTFNPIAVTINALPIGTLAVTESSGTPNDNIICAGAPVTFTVTPSGASNYAFYLNGTGSALQSTSSNKYTSTTLANGNYITVVVSNASGCQITLTSPAITVIQPPTGSLTVSPSNTICAGDNARFAAPKGYSNYTFKINGATAYNGPDSIFNTIALANNNVVTVDVSNSNNCISTFGPITMQVNALPTGNLAIAETSGLANNDGIICTGATVVFTATSGFSNYNFLLNGASIQNGSSNVYTTSTLNNNDKVTVTVTNGSGCVALFNTYTITVNPLPTVAAITGAMSVCVNRTTTLSDATSGGSWSSSDPTIATIDATTGIVTGVKAGTVTILYTTAKDASGCTNSVSTTVTVNALPLVAAIGGLSDVCVNSTIPLTDGTSGGTWSTGDVTIATVDGSGNVTGVANGTVTISYSLTNGNGCTTIINKTINVHALPVVPAVTGTFNVCVNATTTLADATGGGVWSSGNTAVATVNSSTGVVTGVTAGTATISYIVTDANGCSTTVTQDITVNDLPVPTLSGPNPICLGSTNNVYTTETGSGIHNYLWNVVNGTVTAGGTSTDNTVTISWLTPGAKSISVNYTDNNGCVGATFATVVNAPGTSPTVGGLQTVCQGTTGVTYTAPSGEIDYSWTVSAGGTITAGGHATDPTVTVTWNGSGAQSVTINYADSGGCSAATPTVWPVTVNPLPTLVINNPAAVCSSSTVDLTAAAVTAGSTPSLTYTYYTDAAGTTTLASPNAVATSGTYYIKGTTAAGCSDVIKPVTVTINPLPTLVVNNPAAVCAPSTVDLTAAAVTAGSTPSLTYTYYTDAAGTTTLASPNAVATSGTYYIKGTTAAGCSDVIKPVTVTINPLPTLVINNPAQVCSPSTVDLTAAAVTAGSTSGLTYTYYTDAGGTTTLASPNAVATSGTYYIKGTTAAGCSDVIKPVTVTINPLPTLVINNPVAVCAPSTVDLTAAAVTAGSTSGLTYTYYTDAAGTTTLASPNAVATSGTYYIKGTTAAGCSDVIKPVTVTINPLPTLVINNPAAVCAPSTVDLTAAAVTAGSTPSLTYTYYTDAGGTTTLASPNAVNTSGTYYIKGTTAAGCSGVIKPVLVTVTPAPTAVAGTAVSTCANSGAVNITAGSGATNQSSVLWTSSGTGTFANSNSLTLANYTPSVADITAGSVTLTLTANGNGSCAAVASTKTLTIIAIPTISVVPVTATICQGSIQALTATSTGSPGPKTQTFASGSINVNIPDATFSRRGGTNPGENNTLPITVSGIPAGAVITNITVSLLSVTETSDGDLNFNIKAPNGNRLNLVNRRGGTSNNGFTNTLVTWNGGVSLGTGTAPFTGIYAPDTTLGLGPGGNTSNVTSFSFLTSIPDGGWTLYVEDAVDNGSSGSINSWSVTIDYTVPVSNPVTWSPVTDLYTDAGATIPYTGQSMTTVYAEPGSPGNVVYTATATNASGCTNTAQTTLTVTPTPVVSISADYCLVPGKVVLTASSVPAATTYLWNTGGTKDTIQVNVANNYSVTVSAGGCPGTGNITVAQNLVVNGDFSAGATGFISSYNLAYLPWNGICNDPNNQPDGQPNGLLDENSYAVSTSGQLTHCNFWGGDHTTGTGNFMLVNGAGVSYEVWQETVNVLPNTTYYFSAWGMSLNNVGPFASLQFNINGAQVGSVDNLASGVDANNNGTVASGAPWSQFYGNWTSGPTTTTAVISITDLQTAANGNDFGLDDINFGTLSPFIYLVSAPGTDAQTPCVNTPITPIVYSVGSTSAGPTISSPLPAGLTGTFSPGSGLYTITGTPTVAGNYTYTLTTTGSCNPTSASGTINIQSQTITLSSGNANPVQCKTAPVNFGFTLGGTATNASATGLPVGVSGSTSGNIFTISGTPSDAAGVYHYSIMTTGTCTPDTVTGTITLQQQTITHNSGDSLQTVCINVPLSNIQYTISGPAPLNGTVTGLPGGVSYTYNTGILIISGTPNAAGTFKYYVTGSGGCADTKDSGVITVTPAATLTLTSSAGTDGQTVCINSPITTITYSLNNATNATVDDLPDGVTGSVTGGVLSITGTPTETGTFTYTITTSGGCGAATSTGTITVQSQTIGLTTGIASPTLCQNTAMTPIVYTIGGTAIGASISGQPAGVNGVLSGNTFTISGTPSVSGTFQYIVTVSGGCAIPVADTGIITVQQAAVGGNIVLVSTSVCNGGTASMTLMNQVGTIVGWESSVDGGTTWTGPNGNTTISESATNVLVPTLWRVEISNGCGITYSSIATVGIHNLWTGAAGTTDWNTGSNWSDGMVPSTTCPTVLVPVVAINKYPVLSTSPKATITNLQINAGASVTIMGNTIQIAGTITNGGIFDVTNGTVELNGTTTQNIEGKNFFNNIPGENNTVQNLIISNDQGVNVAGTANDTLNITGTLSFGTSNAQLTTGNNITLKSSYSATANVGVLASGNAISGNVTVERYINSGTGANYHGVSWQHLATPAQGQTVFQSWMEGGIKVSTGYGTQITDASGTINGFDTVSANPSMKVYNYLTDGWTGIPNTGIQLYNKKGYLIFVRGDRSINYPHVGNTVLRSTGTLFTAQPGHLPPVTTVISGDFESVGNPYASAIDIRKITLGPNTNNTFIVWDPALTTSPSAYGYGGFQTLYLQGGNYINLLTTPDYGAAGTIHNYIQSGQAFFAQATGGNGSVSFTENAKVNGSEMLFRQQGVTGEVAQLRADLDVVNSDSTSGVRDANLIQYSTDYSNKIDRMDARKMMNSAENFGILSGGENLVIERRAGIQKYDTIFYHLTGLRAQKYKIMFTASGLSAYGLQGYIEDTYLYTRTSLNMEGTTEADFTVTNAAGSYAANRFRIVFAPQPPTEVALTFISLTANQQDADIAVNWKVQNEKGMKQYEVETSMDGVNFTKAATVLALNNGVGTYQWTDKNVTAGDHYYRIRCVADNGSISYSTVVKVTVVYGNPSISIHPNPITDGIIHLQFVNQLPGRYSIRLINSLGQLIAAPRQIELAGGGNATENIQWNYYLAHGVYQLEITRPDGSVKVIKVLY